MFLIPRRQVLTGPPQGGVPELAPEWAGKVRKVIVNGVLPKGAVAGSTIGRQTTKFGTSLVQASRIWNSNVGSQYAINLGTRPNSATFLIIAERNCDCNIEQNIPFIMNCATLGDGGVSIAMGNWWDSSNLRNKLHSGAGNPKWINGVAQTLNDGLSNADLISDTPYNIVVSMGTMTGGEYKLFAKDDSAGGYVSPVKIHLFVELDLQSPESAKSLSANPWQIFKRPDSRIFVPVSVGGGSVNANASGALSAVAVTAPSASASGGASSSGALSAVAVTAPSASASGGASSSGALATITISSPTATASAGGSASASGSFAAISISPATATATATKSATASGSFAVVSLSAPTATASGTTAGGAVATGAPAQITISHAAAIAIGSAVASGGYQSIGITAPIGTASVGNGNATASGAWAAISITAPTAYASSGFIRAPAGRGPTVIQAGSYRPSNTGGRRY